MPLNFCYITFEITITYYKPLSSIYAEKTSNFPVRKSGSICPCFFFPCKELGDVPGESGADEADDSLPRLKDCEVRVLLMVVLADLPGELSLLEIISFFDDFKSFRVVKLK